MNTAFQKLMNDATRLTRSGDLQAATAAIQAALRRNERRAPAKPGRAFDVIDVHAREVPARTSPRRSSPVSIRQRPAISSPAVPAAAPRAATTSSTFRRAPARAAAAGGDAARLHQDPDDFAKPAPA